VQDLVPLPARPSVEEPAVVEPEVLLDLGRGGVGVLLHRLEARGRDELGPAVLRDVDFEPRCERAHLAFEVVQHVVVVQHDDVRLVARPRTNADDGAWIRG